MTTTTYVLAGGCFWCLEAVYRAVRGVTNVTCGYAGGSLPDPQYDEVCTGTTGHAEAVALEFDDEVIPAEVVLDMFFTLHDPTQLNRQGADIGTQYRSAMFPLDDAQRDTFTAAIERAAQLWGDGVVTTLEPLETFWPADEQHQDFFAKNPDNAYCNAVAAPKVRKVRAGFTEWMQ